MEKSREIAIDIIELFENLLEENNFTIPDDGRTGEDGESRLYGYAYYSMEDQIVELLEKTTQKTDKFNDMISGFQCDFSLAKEGENKLSELNAKLEKPLENQKLMNDIKLLEELELRLRYGTAEIHLVEPTQ